MGLPNGVHHLAICTKDIKKQIEYFTDIVGMELVALYWMHGVDNTFHGFLKLSDSSSIAFVQHPDIAKIQPSKGERENPGRRHVVRLYRPAYALGSMSEKEITHG